MGSCARTLVSPTNASPASGSTIRLKQRSNVVLPEPLSPTSATAPPAGTSSDTSSSARVASNLWVKCRAESGMGMSCFKSVTWRTPE